LINTHFGICVLFGFEEIGMLSFFGAAWDSSLPFLSNFAPLDAVPLAAFVPVLGDVDLWFYAGYV